MAVSTWLPSAARAGGLIDGQSNQLTATDSERPCSRDPPGAAGVSPQQAADLLGVSRSTIVRWLSSGQLAGARNAGGEWQIVPAAVQTFKRAHLLRSGRVGFTTGKRHTAEF